MPLDPKLKSAKSQAQINQKVIDEINGLEDGTLPFGTVKVSEGSLEINVSPTQLYFAYENEIVGIIMNDGGSLSISGGKDPLVQIADLNAQRFSFNYGSTSDRPSAARIAEMYFDTTIGKPIWCKQDTPSVIWVDATGATV